MLILLISVCLVLHCRALLKSCDGIVTQGTLLRFHIDGCEKDKCVFRSNDHMTGIVRFIPHIKSEKIQARMSANFWLFQYRVPGFEKDGCQGFGVDCPLVPWAQYVYKISATIPFVPWKINTMAKFTLSDGKDTYFVCVNVPMEVIPSFIDAKH